ncbi:MAG: hypothetical protein ACRCVJ_17885 [Clostridium sp.]|uniref:hypothetical protein n=1 Tax=Clostridium sp. TaxID=1506 RepID=UPI003F340F53
MKFLFIFFIFFCYRLIDSVCSFIKIRSLHKMYIDWLSGKPSNICYSNKETIILFKKAKIRDSGIPVVEPLGYGRAASYTASIFESFPNNREDFVYVTDKLFFDATGTFLLNIKNCFNPLFWINSILFAPKMYLEYLGIDTSTIIMKFFTSIITLFFWIAGAATTMFSSEIKDFIITFFKK